ncbi:uncharacterized protein LOC123523607 [Mercenaria mercenaria]|uniref:uncharacterized protein LOC123523607 n=1 Tax=Mercenaria mercenaria TaxID=6596 RepID=UPI00234ED71E|nr:uncharacterized protein LOC123523607 [Mercenaria mercenaria]
MCDGSPPPVRNFTTVTLFTDLKTWNEAARICEDQGGKILDITYFSLFSIMLSFASVSPWKDLPIGNGPVTWIGLHRRTTLLGDMYYSHDCERLSDFKVAYWNTNSPYTEMDGDVTSYCVYHQILVSASDKSTTYTHDYTRASCDEQHQFYCMSENGSCIFEEIDGYYGDSSRDFTPDNDVIYPYESDDKCADLCLNSWSVFTHPDIHVVEECWGFSTSGTECRLHNVLKPYYLDITLNRIALATRKLFIKRCFASAVNNNVFDVPSDSSIKPNTTCGIPVMGNSTVKSLQVFVYRGLWTWNEAFTTCNQSGLELLQIRQQDDYSAIQQLINKYAELQSMDYIWLGLHEPDPVNHTDVRVWADCGATVSSNWDPASPPSLNITDTSLCVVLDTSSNYWYTTRCNEQHFFICSGEYGVNHSYTTGREYSTDAEFSLGPYNVTEQSCKDMCSTLTYEDHECWGYAVLIADTDAPTECFLHFGNVTYSSTESYIQYTKLIWSDTVLHRVGEADNSLIPKSCCDVSGMKSECLVNNVPVYSESVPTAKKLNLLLYTQYVTWNEASSVCNGVGGTLLQPNDASKRFMLQRYVDTWITNGSLSGDLWIGLSQLHLDDPCSLRWTSDCSRPAFTDFINVSYTELRTTYCTAINSDIKFVKKSCDEKLQFVCEIYAGNCDILDVVSEINCILGPLGASLTVPRSTCLSDCRVMTYNNMECWAVVMTGPNTCDLIFHIDPEYCKENYISKRQYHAVFKTCYTASVSELAPVVHMDTSIFPKTSCFDLIPAELNEAVCAITLRTTTASSTTLPVQPSSVSQSSTAIPPFRTLPVQSSSVSLSSTAIPPFRTLPVQSSSVSQSSTAISPFRTLPVQSSSVSQSSTAIPPFRTLPVQSSSVSQSSTAIPPFRTLPVQSSSVLQSSTTIPPFRTLPVQSSSVSQSSTAIPPFRTLSVQSSSVSQSSTAIPPFRTLPVQSSSVSQSSTAIPEFRTLPVMSSSMSQSSTAIPPFRTLPVQSSSVSQSSTAIPPFRTFPVQSSSVSQSSTSTTQATTETKVFVTNVSVSFTPTSTSSMTSTYAVSSTQLYTLTTETVFNVTRADTVTTQNSLPTTAKLASNFTSSSVKPIYISPCLCYTRNRPNVTMEEWQELFVLTNTVSKQNTSRYKRKLSSVKDQRTSALTIGITALSVLIALLLYIITTDISRISKSVSYIHGINSKKKQTTRKHEPHIVKAKTVKVTV